MQSQNMQHAIRNALKNNGNFEITLKSWAKNKIFKIKSVFM